MVGNMATNRTSGGLTAYIEKSEYFQWTNPAAKCPVSSYVTLCRNESEPTRKEWRARIAMGSQRFPKKSFARIKAVTNVTSYSSISPCSNAIQTLFSNVRISKVEPRVGVRKAWQFKENSVTRGRNSTCSMSEVSIQSFRAPFEHSHLGDLQKRFSIPFDLSTKRFKFLIKLTHRFSLLMSRNHQQVQMKNAI